MSSIRLKLVDFGNRFTRDAWCCRLKTKKHTIDLSAQLAECEANYARIMRLLPDMETVNHREFGVELPNGQSVRFCIEVIERCKYTTMLELYQQQGHEAATPWSPAPCFALRVYHDARMTEVTRFDRQQALRASYDYPNNKMFQRDEKTQLNTFLGEWLQHCLKYGHVLDQPGEQLMCRLSG